MSVNVEKVEYETDQDYDDEPPVYQAKRMKLDQDEKVKRCRERNRVHARNTRERKRLQMDALQQRIQELANEKIRLKESMPETSVASILMSLSSAPASSQPAPLSNFELDDPALDDISVTMEKIRSQVSATLSEDDELDVKDKGLLSKDKSACSSHELDIIRRERNRMHAKKTRMRKKKMLLEMEAIIERLEKEIQELRKEKPQSTNSGINFQFYPDQGGRFNSGSFDCNSTTSSASESFYPPHSLLDSAFLTDSSSGNFFLSSGNGSISSASYQPKGMGEAEAATRLSIARAMVSSDP